MNKEIWKPIKVYEGLYEISTYGRIKRLAGMVPRKNGGYHKVSKRFLKSSLNRNGYPFVCLSKNGKSKSFLIHRLMAENFIPNQEPKIKNIVNHKDGNKENFSLENLEWVTAKENSIHAFTKLRIKKPKNKIELIYPTNIIETWKPIKGYEGLYDVSSLGRIKRLEAFLPTKKGHYQKTKERVLTPFPYKEKNFVCKLTKEGKSKTLYIHRIVAETFLPNPENRPFVQHLDGNVGNNSVDNLTWNTPSENSSLIFNSTKIVLPEIKIDNKDEEIWKDIKGYEGIFQISSYGRVKSLNRVVTDKLGRQRIYKERIKDLRIKNGYPHVILNKNGKQKTIPVHRAVAEAFIPNPKRKKFVNHINAITNDNRVENLEWSTPKENSQHMSSLDRGKVKPVQQYDLLGNLITEYPSAIRAAKKCNIDYPTLLTALNRERDSSFSNGFQWKYKDEPTPIGVYKDAREKNVLQYSLEGKYITTFPSVAQAVEFLKDNGHPNASTANISKACTGVRRYSYDSQWRYEDDDTPILEIKKQIQNIVQLTLDGEYINTYSNFREAERAVNAKQDTKGISKCCRGKQKVAYGFRWVYEEEYLKNLECIQK